MKNNRSAKPLPWLAGVAFFIMVGVNGMANALPIMGGQLGIFLMLIRIYLHQRA